MDEIDTKKLVRIYSFHAEERLAMTSHAQTLGRVLSDTEPSLDDILAPWRIFYEPWEAQDGQKYVTVLEEYCFFMLTACKGSDHSTSLG